MTDEQCCNCGHEFPETRSTGFLQLDGAGNPRPPGTPDDDGGSLGWHAVCDDCRDGLRAEGEEIRVTDAKGALVALPPLPLEPVAPCES